MKLPITDQLVGVCVMNVLDFSAKMMGTAKSRFAVVCSDQKPGVEYS